MSWSPASDGKLPPLALTYNLRLGTTPGGGQLVASMSDNASGCRRLPQPGNTQQRASWRTKLPGAGVYYWSVQAVDGTYAGGPFAPERTVESPSAVGEIPTVPGFALRLAVPNPFNPITTIAYSVPRPVMVRLEIFDAAGRRVRVLVSEQNLAGNYTARWDGTSDGAANVASGLYFCRVRAGSLSETRRTTLIR